MNKLWENSRQAVKKMAISFSKYVNSLVPPARKNILRKTKINCRH